MEGQVSMKTSIQEGTVSKREGFHGEKGEMPIRGGSHWRRVFMGGIFIK